MLLAKYPNLTSRDREGVKVTFVKLLNFFDPPAKLLKIIFLIIYFPSETVRCSDPSVCVPGLACVNGWCGDPAYFNSFTSSPCQEDTDCQERNTGEMCCLQLDRPLAWRKGKSGLVRKCCNNHHGVPVQPPDHDLSEKELQEVRREEGSQLVTT